MLKIIAIASLFILPAASAGFISSDLELHVEEAPPIPLNEAVTIKANLNFSWGFGAIFPMPLTIYIEFENIPDWLYVSANPSSFTITPLGWRGGSVGRDFTITFRAKDETNAFVIYNLVLKAYTNGSFLINGAESEKAINVMQDFNDRGLTIEKAKGKVKLHESKTFYLNVTNNCNAPIVVNIQQENESKFFELSYENNQIIPSKSKKSISFTVSAKKTGKETIPIKITYFPTGHEERKNDAYTTITLESYESASNIKAISIGIIIVIIASIIVVILKRRK